MNKLDDLQKAMSVLKEAETLTDPAIRRRMQDAVLQLIEVPTEKASTLLVPSPSIRVKVSRTRHSTVKGAFSRDSQQGRVFAAVQALASRAKPVSAADLTGMVDNVGDEAISKNLSRLYALRKVYRIKVFDQDSRGSNRTLYKYYVDEETHEVQTRNGDSGGSSRRPAEKDS